MPNKRQLWTRGAIVHIPLGDGSHSYAQMLDDPEYGFFDLRSTVEVPVEEIVSHAVIFRLWVMRYAHSQGRWLKVGEAELPTSLRVPVLRFNQDPIDPNQIRLTYDGCNGPHAELSDCKGLECAAVWDPDHVEDRLRDYFSGLPNKWALSLRPKGAAPSK
jgi:hypothetical protein